MNQELWRQHAKAFISSTFPLSATLSILEEHNSRHMTDCTGLCATVIFRTQFSSTQPSQQKTSNKVMYRKLSCPLESSISCNIEVGKKKFTWQLSNHLTYDLDMGYSLYVWIRHYTHGDEYGKVNSSSNTLLENLTCLWDSDLQKCPEGILYRHFSFFEMGIIEL